MSLVTQLTQGESVTKQKAVKVAIVDVAIGSGLGVVQGIVQSKDRIVMGSVRLTQLVPIIEIIGGTAAMVLTKNNALRSISSKVVIAGSTILGYTTLSPIVVGLINHSSTTSTVNARKINNDIVRPAGLGFQPNAFYS